MGDLVAIGEASLIGLSGAKCAVPRVGMVRRCAVTVATRNSQYCMRGIDT